MINKSDKIKTEGVCSTLEQLRQDNVICTETVLFNIDSQGQ
ncbi:MAG: hypothetical protein V5788_10320 [Shewanella sp.]